MVLISAGASTIAADLKRIDKRLCVRWCEAGNPPYFAVYMEPEGGCPCPNPDCFHGELVLTAQELDDRIVKRIEYIDTHGRSGYDFAEALEQQRRDRERRERQEREERAGLLGEQMAHALRRDLGLGPYKGRIFT